MNYELAKELKDSGYKMLKSKDYNMDECPFPWGQFKYTDDEIYLYPTLSELIKACGHLFFQLTKGSGELWYAEGDTEEYPKYTAFSPEEAVAKLWLAINNK